MGDSNVHNHQRCPLFLLGHAGGALKGNLHLKAADGTPMANAMLTLLHKLGLDDMKSFGDSTAALDLNAAPARRRRPGQQEARPDDARRSDVHARAAHALARRVLVQACARRRVGAAMLRRAPTCAGGRRRRCAATRRRCGRC